MNGDGALVVSQSNKPVTIAMEEIAQGKIVYHVTKAGLK